MQRSVEQLPAAIGLSSLQVSEHGVALPRDRPAEALDRGKQIVLRQSGVAAIDELPEHALAARRRVAIKGAATHRDRQDGQDQAFHWAHITGFFKVLPGSSRKRNIPAQPVSKYPSQESPKNWGVLKWQKD